MSYTNRIFLILILCLLFATSIAQEFICNVKVNSKQVQGTDKSVYKDMQSSLTEFINDRYWTKYEFKTEERIECSMVINISDRVSQDVFKGTLSVVASRPVYGTNYTTPLLNYIDNEIEFDYVEFQPMDFQENQDMSNLTSVVAFYLYIILGLDFDSFSQFGGTAFFQKAEAIVSTSQNSAFSGWRSFEDQRNRYWLVENFLNNSYSYLRAFLYQYHRNGLDAMSEKPVEGRQAISQSLSLLENIYDDKPGLFGLTLILDAKRDEIINVFSQGSPQEKTKAQNIMKMIDPANSSKYSKISKRY